jgi:1,4-alpha-glucan branching enzyme
VEAFLEEAGFRYFFMDTHMAEAGTSLAVYGDIPQGVERFDAEWHGVAEGEPVEGNRSPYQSFLVDSDGHGAEVSAFVRDPRSSMQVWSRHHGYPGDEWYLEFHKIRWPGGLKYWRVTGPNLDLGAKTAYVPEEAGKRVRAHASHFAGLLKEIRDTEGLGASGVVMAPFDTELFGHWWFEGVDFIREVYTAIAGPATGPIPVTASEHLDSFPSTHAIRPLEGSWGANGDFSMWLNPETRWTWERLWPLEERFWTLAPGARADETRDEILAQAGRQLLLAQSSDWQFMISTGAVPDYAEKRFNLHCDDLEELLRALEPQASPEAVEQGRRKAAALDERDDLFPNILDSLDRVLRRD